MLNQVWIENRLFQICRCGVYYVEAASIPAFLRPICAARTKARTTEWTRVLKNSGQFSKNCPTIEYSKSQPKMTTKKPPRFALQRIFTLVPISLGYNIQNRHFTVHFPKQLENSKWYIVCCINERIGCMSNSSPESETRKSTSSCVH